MNDLFHRFEFIRAYIDDLLIFKRGNQTYNVQKLELMIIRLKEKVLKFNV